MSLHIVSWNVNGFHASGTRGPRKLILRQELQPAVIGRLDLLMLQEHKLSAAHASRCGKVLPGRSHTFWEPSVGEQGRSGGVCTSISVSISQSVFCHSSLIPDQALWVGLDLEGSRIGVLNIYAPTYFRHRVTFWRTLIELLQAMDS